MDIPTEEELAKGITDFVMFLEECDSQECIYTHKALMEGSMVLYEFRDKSRGSAGRSAPDKDNG